MSSRAYKVSEVARMAGVSVRTLHHYDSIGLLVPSGRSESGYRLYSEDDLLRLQQILIGRALGLSLEDVRGLLDPKVDRRALLLRQREQLMARARQAQAMIRSIDAALAVLDDRESQEVSKVSSKVDFKAIFDGFDPADYEQEARERWGNSDAYRESEQRARNYTEQDWRALKAEADAIMKDAAAAFGNHVQPTDPTVMAIAERHRLHIERWFYPCSPSMHAALADMYEADERFARSIDQYAAGLTPFWSAAIRANTARLQGKG